MNTKLAQKSGNKSQADEGLDQGEDVTRPTKEIIKKYPVDPAIANYEKAYTSFSWQEARSEVHWFGGDMVNAAYNAVDRHMYDGRRNKVALYSIGVDNKLHKLTFYDIYEQSNRLGNALKKLGVQRGDRVFFFLPRVPELYIATIAIANVGDIIGPLFSAFRPDALKDR